MDSRVRKCGGVLLVGLLLFAWKTRAAERGELDAPPNVLILFSDQHVNEVLGIAGSTVVQTPNLDRLATDGAWFTHCAQPCAESFDPRS